MQKTVPIRKTPEPNVPRARALRHSSTDAERKMWGLLRGRRLAGFKFRRQFPVGKHIADFACFSHRLVVEIDGGQHAIQVGRDEARTRAIEKLGYRVIRFWNNDVLANPEGVLTMILGELQRQPGT